MHLEKAVSLLDKREDEHDKFGANVAAKLRKMEPTQCIYPESLINQVLFGGMLQRLQENSSVYHPPNFTKEVGYLSLIHI